MTSPQSPTLGLLNIVTIILPRRQSHLIILRFILSFFCREDLNPANPPKSEREKKKYWSFRLSYRCRTVRGGSNPVIWTVSSTADVLTTICATHADTHMPPRRLQRQQHHPHLSCSNIPLHIPPLCSIFCNHDWAIMQLL